jgi:hypothetical protein
MAHNTRKLLLGLLGGSASFNPLTIPGLALWLDASDAATLFQDAAGTTPAAADGDPVGYWGDKSGAGRNAIQATANRKASLQTAELNGKSTVQFADVTANDALVSTFGATLTQPTTIWFVGKSNGTHYFDGISAGARQVLYMSGGSATIFAGAGVAAPFTNTIWHICTVIFNGASSSMRSDGAALLAGNAGANSITGITLGTDYALSGPMNGMHAEFIVASGAASAATIAAVETYLNQKWHVF